jgi:hypothetical protein
MAANIKRDVHGLCVEWNPRTQSGILMDKDGHKSRVDHRELSDEFPDRICHPGTLVVYDVPPIFHKSLQLPSAKRVRKA